MWASNLSLERRFLMYCKNCGAKIEDDAVFCPSCGAKLNAPAQAKPSANLPEGISQDDEGYYHWVYIESMWQNPTALFIILKIFLFVMLFLMVIIMISSGDFASTFLMFLALYAVLAVISVIAYAIVALMHKGQNIVLHTMTPDYVMYEQTEDEEKLSKNIAMTVAILNALASKRNGAAFAAAQTSLVSNYSDVKKIIATKGNIIKVNNVLQHNMIYAYPHQYDFVFNYIVDHCPNAKVVRR